MIIVTIIWGLIWEELDSPDQRITDEDSQVGDARIKKPRPVLAPVEAFQVLAEFLERVGVGETNVDFVGVADVGHFNLPDVWLWQEVSEIWCSHLIHLRQAVSKTMWKDTGEAKNTTG